MNIITNTTNTTTNTNNTKTMTSLEIANLVESRHDSVKRTVERLVESGIIGQPPTVDDLFVDAQGKTRTTKVYLIDQRSSYVIVAQLSPAFTARLVDRWQELESQLESQVAATPKLPVSYVEALEALVASEKEKLVLTHQLEVAAPKIAFAEAVESSDDLILVRDLAKLIAGNGVDIGEKRLYTWLRENKYLMYDNSPYQSAMDRGLFKVTESIYKQGNQTKITKTTKITGKGQQYLLAKFL
jgi:anti-repressor protein